MSRQSPRSSRTAENRATWGRCESRGERNEFARCLSVCSRACEDQICFLWFSAIWPLYEHVLRHRPNNPPFLAASRLSRRCIPPCARHAGLPPQTPRRGPCAAMHQFRSADISQEPPSNAALHLSTTAARQLFRRLPPSLRAPSPRRPAVATQQY